ncbi:D-alanyl-D-alanine carboxypeptidase/D-alanyl-D-alanine-endopeptidase [Rhodococcoides kyotonense]|uniref:D-alanyl-D-alanine carboxypeptidase / D-alanyl-D-alanine-endopeptidase (Penicillin-binding protein 4) n=1 Tax=Rhodococcoides kyotonense TaxID=398843 RepID=A0A239MTK7_9NOCA|nr:D-alanyl-D-alanine carboxypeptidase [Rhodococcus kyotonensis]SNT45298.1 D-alanyl-D-alanine carboxypeptidase / D-alanyl-D-alanine-endopeptidase (penicillin-binding protein 4) [Rhodococcus kyotonensis]
MTVGKYLALAAVGVLLVAACSNDATASETTGSVGTLPPEAVDIMQTEPYTTARWPYLVVDPATDEVIYSSEADKRMLLASQTKHFTVGTVYDELGADRRVTTPVYATAAPSGGTLTGDLVLVGSGDLALGGRGASEGKFEFATDGIDHVYADALPGAVLAPGDPLAGLNDLARQVAASGVNRIDGDVLVDARLWETYSTVEGLVPSIFVNDNLVDIQASPGSPGEPASIEMLPGNGLFTLDAQVTTGAADSDSTLAVEADAVDPTLIRVSGSVPAGKTSLTVFRITDAESWARQLFVEALQRNGVTVSSTSRVNDAASLPASDGYQDALRLASLESAPLGESGGMILATSYNTGANTFLCLLAVELGSDNCEDGLPTVRALADEAGVPATDLVITDGQGGDPSSATPQAIITWLKWVDEQPWADTFWAGQPILGERGSLVGVGVDSPAKGLVVGKTGTSADVEPVTERLFINLQALSGYFDVGDGRRLLFVVGVMGAVFPDLPRGVFQVGDDVGMVAAAMQQAQAAE